MADNDPTGGAASPALAPAAAPAAAPAPPAAAPALTQPAVLDWSSVVIVAAGAPAPGEKRPVIVIETRGDDGKLIETRTYPAGDLYYRTDPSIGLGADPAKEVVTLGVDVGQSGFGSFSTNPNNIHVGPASPVFGAANLAFLRGAMTIDILGLTPAQKIGLRPWFDALAANPNLPPQLKVNLV